jgi:hypothetical protein
MRKLWIAIAVLLAAVVLFVVSIFGFSEQGGEVVTLTTFEADGSEVETRLWVVDASGSSWLRAGVPASGWLLRAEAHPVVEVERGGRSNRYRAVPVREPESRDQIHALMRAKYGFADRWISLIRDGQSSVAVRLVPIPPGSS